MNPKCPLCDFENKAGSKFCKNCNEPLFKQRYSEDNPYIKKWENKDRPFELISNKEEKEEIKIFDLKTSSVEEIVEYIKNKRIANRRKFHENSIKAEKLIESGKFKEAQKLTREDVVAYYHVYAEAEKKEKAGKLEEAAELYWTNISTNGTDAPANFTQLMIILKKLGRLSEALKVSEIYDKYFYRKMT
ncbi:MAG: zinc ribbon domain-containing protein [Candidatus Lokiarchaeota archaeon]|nr:zinc ribbon domain-containing protein [Candidatus Lokiarchaeota archaeon]